MALVEIFNRLKFSRTPDRALVKNIVVGLDSNGSYNELHRRNKALREKFIKKVVQRPTDLNS